jgi:hypothetical protein
MNHPNPAFAVLPETDPSPVRLVEEKKKKKKSRA